MRAQKSVKIELMVGGAGLTGGEHDLNDTGMGRGGAKSVNQAGKLVC